MGAGKVRGFTLIEVIVVIAIIAILAAIALPAFGDQVRKSRRAEMQGVLEEQRLKLEKYRVDHPSYATYTMPALSTQFYTVTFTGAGPAAYTLTATAQGTQTKDTACTPLVLANTNGVISQSPASCW